MSTRSLVKVIGEYSKVNIYHHWDGYPEGVGFFLMEKFYDKLIAKADPEDPFSTNLDFNDVVNALIKDKDDEGYELTQYKHTDIEYLYEINTKEKTIRCWEIGHNWEKGTLWKRKEIDLIGMFRRKEAE